MPELRKKNVSKKSLKKRKKCPKFEAEILDLFNKYDIDKNGYLDMEEIRTAMKDMYSFLREMNIPFTDYDIDKMVQDADSNSDGKIEIKEFVNLI